MDKYSKKGTKIIIKEKKENVRNKERRWEGERDKAERGGEGRGWGGMRRDGEGWGTIESCFTASGSGASTFVLPGGVAPSSLLIVVVVVVVVVGEVAVGGGGVVKVTWSFDCYLRETWKGRGVRKKREKKRKEKKNKKKEEEKKNQQSLDFEENGDFFFLFLPNFQLYQRL